MFVSEAIRDFASYSQTIRGYSKNTQHRYLNHCRQFERWLAEQKNLSNLPVHEVTP